MRGEGCVVLDKACQLVRRIVIEPVIGEVDEGSIAPLRASELYHFADALGGDLIA